MKRLPLTPARIVLGALGALALGLLLVRDAPLLTKPTPPGPAGPLPGGPLPKGTTALTSYLSDAFFRRILDLSAYFRSKGANVQDEDLVAVLFVESGGLHADAVNPKSGCVGLNQICPTNYNLLQDPARVSGLRAVGWTGTREDYLKLTPEDQLTYVQRYFDNQGKYHQMTDYGMLYLVNFSPAFFAPPSAALWKGRYPIMYAASDPHQVKDGVTLPNTYDLNASIDLNPKKGFIELADMAKFVARATQGVNKPKWDELRLRLAKIREAA